HSKQPPPPAASETLRWPARSFCQKAALKSLAPPTRVESGLTRSHTTSVSVFVLRVFRPGLVRATLRLPALAHPPMRRRQTSSLLRDEPQPHTIRSPHSRRSRPASFDPAARS